MVGRRYSAGTVKTWIEGAVSVSVPRICSAPPCAVDCLDASWASCRGVPIARVGYSLRCPRHDTPGALNNSRFLHNSLKWSGVPCCCDFLIDVIG